MLLTAYKVAPAVYRLRPGATEDSYGDPVESWDAPERVRLKGATLQDAHVYEAETESPVAHIVRGEKALFVPGVADLTEHDRIEVRGEVWRVNGVPTVRHGLGSASYTTAALTRSTA